MKRAIVSILVAGMLSNSGLVLAEGPVPLKEMMRPAGTELKMEVGNAGQDESKAATNQKARTHMTEGGKVMTGVGVGLCAIGGFVVIANASLSYWGSSSDRAKIYGAGAGTLGAGAVLIVLGYHRRAAY